MQKTELTTELFTAQRRIQPTCYKLDHLRKERKYLRRYLQQLRIVIKQLSGQLLRYFL